jgi:hypothetical protein
MLGGLYQSVLRSELTARFGVGWGRIVNGQAEIAGTPDELLTVFSKRTAAIDDALEVKVDDFRQREGREPSRWERAALIREASADTRARKTGNGAADLVAGWAAEAAHVGWTADALVAELERVGAEAPATGAVAVPISEIVSGLSTTRSSWCRADVVQALCDLQRPVPDMPGGRWASIVERATDRVLEQLVDLDPKADGGSRRGSDGRSVWIEPTAARFTSTEVLAQEEHVVSWALLAQTDDPAPSLTVEVAGLDPLQAAAAATVAGQERLAMIVGPAGAGKTRTLAAAVADLERRGRPLLGVSPTAKAARVLQRDTGMHTDTVAKLLYDWHQPGGLSGPLGMPAGGTLVVDEAGMLSTPALYDLARLAQVRDWRLVLVGDPRQLQAIGRGGLFGELCATGRVDTLEQLHRFSQPWEAAASLRLRVGDTRALDAYQHHDRIAAGPLDGHVTQMAAAWLAGEADGRTVALVASTNDHVDLLNRTVQQARHGAGHLDTTGPGVAIVGGGRVWPGDVVMTRRNDRQLRTTTGETVRNRELWTATATHPDGALTVARRDGGDEVTLPPEYVGERVQLGYAATTHGYQADTVDTAWMLATPATTRRSLYVGMTRGRDDNVVCVVTDSSDIDEARDILEGVLAIDRADVPAVVARRQLADAVHDHTPTPPALEVGRCAVPAWFPAMLDDARQVLADAQGRQANVQARHEAVETAVAAAAGRLAEVTQETAADREALADARRRAQEARFGVGAAERRLDAAGWRQRRPLRQQLDDARTRQDRANEYLTRVEARTAPAVERYGQAVGEHRRAEDDRRTVGTLAQLNRLDVDVPTAVNRVRALEVWERWAGGDPVPNRQLHATLQVLGQMSPTGQTRHLIGELANDPVIVEARAQRPAVVHRGPAPSPGYDHNMGIDRSDGMDFGR